jgi:hypothetical protein
MNKKLWFRAKTYGWGWTPCSWEGWLITGLFVFFEYWNFVRLDAVSYSSSDTLRPFIIQTLLAVAAFLVVAYWRGEKPGWRWGK